MQGNETGRRQTMNGAGMIVFGQTKGGLATVKRMKIQDKRRTNAEGYRQMPMSLSFYPHCNYATFAPAAQEKLAFSRENLLLPGPRLQVPPKRVAYIRRESKAATTYYTFEPPYKSSGYFHEPNSLHTCRQDASQTYFLTSCHREEGLSESSEAGGLKTGSSSSREARARIVYAVTTSEPTRRRHPNASVPNWTATPAMERLSLSWSRYEANGQRMLNRVLSLNSSGLAEGIETRSLSSGGPNLSSTLGGARRICTKEARLGLVDWTFALVSYRRSFQRYSPLLQPKSILEI
ncbi:hypothetical protein ARMGADRAFT_1032808 [Armillaria gallica]|uniref:Uncharacterized protein n=1 Tax=Armillaria gallica TaxID=47427 RepID=A0A2H3D4U5_ARMGA|nr:hypothetical protein ARMGADRAFT_1032808 [Armillaria gallica]